MKFSTVFMSMAALACSAIAEPVPTLEQTLTTRDLAVVESAVARVVDSIKVLTKSVVEFDGDSIQIEADAAALATSIELGAQSIMAGAGNLDLTDIGGLTGCIGNIADAGKDLITQLTVKKSQFEQAGLCPAVEDFMTKITDNSKQIISSVCNLIPEPLRPVVEKIGNTIADILFKGADAFSTTNCRNNALANTSKSMIPYPTGTDAFPVIPTTWFSAEPIGAVTNIAVPVPSSGVPTTRTETLQVTVTSCQPTTSTAYSIVTPTTSASPSFLPTGTEALVVPVPSEPIAVSSTYLITAPGSEPTMSTTFSAAVPTVSKPANTATPIPIAAGHRHAISSASLVAGAAIVAAMVF